MAACRSALSLSTSAVFTPRDCTGRRAAGAPPGEADVGWAGAAGCGRAGRGGTREPPMNIGARAGGVAAAGRAGFAGSGCAAGEACGFAGAGAGTGAGRAWPAGRLADCAGRFRFGATPGVGQPPRVKVEPRRWRQSIACGAGLPCPLGLGGSPPGGCMQGSRRAWSVGACVLGPRAIGRAPRVRRFYDEQPGDWKTG